MKEQDWWRANKSQKATQLADDILALASRARGAGFEVVAHVLDLAAKEASAEAEQQVDPTR